MRGRLCPGELPSRAPKGPRAAAPAALLVTEKTHACPRMTIMSPAGARRHSAVNGNHGHLCTGT